MGLRGVWSSCSSFLCSIARCPSLSSSSRFRMSISAIRVLALIFSISSFDCLVAPMVSMFWAK